MKILVLGAGLQGKAALHDLAGSPDVTAVIAADLNIADLAAFLTAPAMAKITAVALDAHNEAQVAQLMTAVDAVIHLLPPHFRAAMARLAVQNGCHFIDASYSLPDYHTLHNEAVARNVAILPEFGLDPGIDLIVTAQAIGELDEVLELHSYGAGIPEAAAADNLLQYKISWSFAGVLNSYMRPARLIQRGQPFDIPERELFDPVHIHMVDVTGLGILEAYPNGDAVQYIEAMGLTGQVRSAGRYSMRWPGHSAFWGKLVHLGFLNDETIPVDGQPVSPRRFIHELLAPQLQYQPHERDVAVIQVDARGMKDGRRRRLIYQVIDWRDRVTGLLAMQRTVGYTASIGAQMILRGDIPGRGLLSPLADVPAAPFFEELQQRGITLQREEQSW
jgi:lysine 6-dehydrogenase